MRTVFWLVAVASLALSGCAGSIGSIGSSPKGLELPIEKTALKFSADVKEGNYRVVSTEELKKWIDEGKKMTIISALPAEDDQKFGTLPGAVNGAMPKTEKELTQAGRDNLLRAAGTDKEKPIVIYCGFVACRRSHLGAKILSENGFQNVFRYPGGMMAWRESGYPVLK